MEISVLDKGFVRLDDAMASDLSVVNAARVSFNKRHDDMEEGDDKLISFLLRNRHGTPFEHNSFRFHIKAPIFVAREWMRHRIGSYNEMSGRYTKLESDFYVPDYVRTQVGKPGAYTFEPVDEKVAEVARFDIEQSYRRAWTNYEAMIDMGVAKEVARIVLPVGIYTQFYWTINARSLMNFISLRNANQALWEIKEYGKVIEEIFKKQMPITAQAFIENGRIAP